MSVWATHAWPGSVTTSSTDTRARVHQAIQEEYVKHVSSLVHNFVYLSLNSMKMIQIEHVYSYLQCSVISSYLLGDLPQNPKSPPPQKNTQNTKKH